MLWPQIYSKNYPHFALILRRPSDPRDPRQILWADLTSEDFVPIAGAAVEGYGTVTKRFQQSLTLHVSALTLRVREFATTKSSISGCLRFTFNAMRDSSQRLTFPATLRDLSRQVVQVQRFYLESLAFLTWAEELHEKAFPLLDSQSPQCNHEYMGVYTTDPALVQIFFRAGIPVWLLRKPSAIQEGTILRSLTATTLPMEAGIIISNPTFEIYCGRIGDFHLAATCMGGHSYDDVEKLPWHDLETNPTPLNARQGPTPSVTPPPSVLTTQASQASSSSLVQ